MSALGVSRNWPTLLAIAVLALACSSSGAGTGDRVAEASDSGTTEVPGQGRRNALKGLVHVHSPFSHDACDGEGLVEEQPNAECRSQLRQALCAADLDFAMLTDHPSHMRDYPFEDLLLFDSASDELIEDGESPVANRMGCGNDHTVLLTVGYEGSPHTMPLGLEHHVAAEHYAGLDNDLATQQAQQLISALESAGAVTSIAHSEDDDISDELIVNSGLDAMEWYNVHGNIQNLLGGDVISGSAGEVLDVLGDLKDFLQGSSSGASSDLIYLLLLQSMPAEGFAKWQRVQQRRPITGLLGSDVHQNVTVDAICNRENPLEQAACVAAAEGILPDYMHSLIAGGPILLADGDRIDSYGRVMRWLHNRVIVEEETPTAIKEALRAGRSYGVFSVFGEPDSFSFSGVSNGQPIEIGDHGSGPLSLRIELPTTVDPVPGATSFTSTAVGDIDVRLVVRRIDSTDVDIVYEERNPSAVVELPAGLAGAYVAELWVTPAHLEGSLGSLAELAQSEYLWILTNPIHLDQ